MARVPVYDGCMIPVAFPSVFVVVLVLFSFLAAFGTLSWLGLLAFSSATRQWHARRRWRNHVLLAVVSLLSVPAILLVYMFWHFHRVHDREQEARRTILQAAQTVDGLPMPAGTRLELDEPGELDTYTNAAFDTPTQAYGLWVTRIERSLVVDDDASTRAHGRHVDRLGLWGEGVQQVEGWQCDMSEKVVFEVTGPDQRVALDSCRLGAGNRVGDMPIPAGMALSARDGQHYTDGHVEPLRWMLQESRPEPLRVSGLWLGHVSLMAGARHELLGVDESVLACPLRLGPVSYPAGTWVRTAAYPLKQRVRDAWIFTPDLGMQARREQGAAIAAGQSVVQRLDGTVLDVVPNMKAGVVLFEPIMVEGVPAPEPVHCPDARRAQ